MTKSVRYTCFLLAILLWLPLSVPAQDAASAPEDQFVSIDFNGVDLSVFIKFMAELTGKNFVVDQRVRGKVTIHSPSEISMAEAYRVFESVLEVHGFTTVEAGAITKVIPIIDARSKDIDTLGTDEIYAPEDKIVTQIMPLKYANPEAVRRLFAPLVSKASVLIAYTPTNTLIVTDVYSNILRLLKILEVIDLPGVGQEVAIIPVVHANATKLVKLLQTVFQKNPRAMVPPGKPGAAQASPVRFVADERTNLIVVLASETDIARVRELVAMLDKKTPRGSERFRVYYLENASAEELVKVLKDIPSEPVAQKPEGGVKTQSILSKDVKVTADKATNSLIIMAEKEEYDVLEDIIRKLDIPRAMVYIECLIMEVNVEKDFALGTEWMSLGKTNIDTHQGGFGGGYSGSGYSNVGRLLAPGSSGAGALPPGFALGIFGELIEIGGVRFPSLAAVINAYAQDREVNILSTPQVLTTDNEKAAISVGKNVPYQTKSGSSDVESFNTFEYRDVGIKLEITPQISKDRMVRLKIMQEVTKLDELSQSSTSLTTPTTLKRTIDTTVVVQDQATVVIGGLIDDSLSNTRNAVPCLGDVPVLGNLFKSASKSGEKTNLFVFLTPHVIQNPDESKEIYEDKQQRMDDIRSGRIKLYE